MENRNRRMKSSLSLSRREFVKTTAGAASALAALSTAGKDAIGAQAQTKPTTLDDAHKHYEEQFRQMESYFQRLIEEHAPAARAAAWRRDHASVDAYRRSVAPMRERLIELLGGWPPKEKRATGAQPRIEPITLAGAQCPFTAKRVWLPAWKDVETYGILLEPRDIPAGERRPAVIAQHGYGGFPEATCGLAEIPGTEYLRAFGRTLAERGYVVFAPLVMHSDLQRLKKLPVIDRTWLDRLALMVGCQFQAWELFKISRVVDLLQSLPNVRADRVAIMGISQGGLTALLTAAMDERIAACVSSGYFNNRTNKMVKRSPHYTAYIGTQEADKFFRGHLLAFEDADVASLICPRPFCVEVGRKDPVTWWPDVQGEFERARAHWAKLGLAERTTWALHEQEHVVDGAEAFRFLDRWLK